MKKISRWYLIFLSFFFFFCVCVCVCRMAAAVEERSSGTIRALVPKLRERLRGWGGCVVWINRLITNRRQKDRRQQQSLHLAVKTVQPPPRGVLTVTSQWSRIKKSKTWRTKQKTETIDLTTFLTFLGACVFLFVYLFFFIIIFRHDSLVCHRCARRRCERREVLAELLETEVRYGRDLRVLQDELYKPLLVAGLVPLRQLGKNIRNKKDKQLQQQQQQKNKS